jgi:hypothetical protein
LTTVFAIECKDGIIMATDTQFTGRFREKGRKAWELRDNLIMGCAGTNNYNYLFWRRLRDEFDEDPEEITLPDRIDQGINKYSEEIYKTRLASFGPRLEVPDYCYPEAVIAGYDEGLERFVMFEVRPPHPCIEAEHDYMRATAGTGGISATVFLKTVEYVMAVAGVKYTDLSWRLVAQLSYLLLRRVTLIDPASSGATLYHVVEGNYNRITYGDIFDKPSSPAIAQFSERVIEEVGIERMLKLFSKWKLLDFLQGLGGSS